MSTHPDSDQEARPAAPEAVAAGPEETLARIRKSRQEAATVRQELSQHAEFLGEAAIDLVCQRFFEEALRKEAGVKDLVAIMAVVLRAREQAIEARKVRLQEEARKERRQPARSRRARQGLTEEALAEIEELAAIL